MSLLKKLAGETAIYGVSSILSRLLHYVILTPFLTRVFLEGEYGVVSEMYTYAALLMVLLTYRMETAFFRFGSKEGKLNTSFSTTSIAVFASTIVFVIVMLIMAQPVADLLRYPDHKDYIIWFTFILAFDALSAIPFAKLRLENRPIKFAALKTLNIIVNIVFLLFFLKFCSEAVENGSSWPNSFFDSNNKIAYVFISNLIASAAVILFLLPEYFKIELKFDQAFFKRMLVYSLPLVVVGIAGVINQLISVPLLKELLPYDLDTNLAHAGVYAAAAKLAVLMNLFIQAFNYAAEPFFFRNAERSDSRTIYADVGQAFALVGATVFLGIMLYLDVLQYFLGEKFRSGLQIVPILLLAYFCLGLYYNFSIWYKLTDKTKIGMWISFAGAAITLGINFTFIPTVGYEAPAYAALACYAFMAAASFLIGKKYYPIDYPIFKMLQYIILALLFYGISLCLKPFFKQNLILQLFFNTLLLLGFLGLIYRIEQKKIKALLKA